MSNKTDIVFLGTPEFSLATLRALHESDNFNVVLVVTAPDKEVGRSLKLKSPAVKIYAEENGIPFIQPENVNTSDVANQIREKFPEFIIVIAFGQILKDEIISIPKFGTINVHASLLPKFRGASPINAAILAGEKETGVTIMQIDTGIDTGGVYAFSKIPINERETAGSLSKKLSKLGADLLLQTLPKILSGEISPIIQSEGESSYAKKLKKQDGAIDWHQSAQTLDLKIRAFSPWPGTFTMLPDGRRLKILEALPDNTSRGPAGTIAKEGNKLFISCGKGSLEITRLQIQGSPDMSGHDFINGYSQFIGNVLT